MKISLQKHYWKVILALLESTRVMATYCLGQKKEYCKELLDDCNVCINEIERLLKEEKQP